MFEIQCRILQLACSMLPLLMHAIARHARRSTSPSEIMFFTSGQVSFAMTLGLWRIVRRSGIGDRRFCLLDWCRDCSGLGGTEKGCSQVRVNLFCSGGRWLPRDPIGFTDATLFAARARKDTSEFAGDGRRGLLQPPLSDTKPALQYREGSLIDTRTVLLQGRCPCSKSIHCLKPFNLRAVELCSSHVCAPDLLFRTILRLSGLAEGYTDEARPYTPPADSGCPRIVPSQRQPAGQAQG
ncbi:hypothetical protein BAUCODRAFT_386644 [Baudoinia panamericana UAMH 10762]|uniref:Uncharacterized protein n=1 Tax=Baudoinia panamericana (strain UAMH 10762) TaxID=717646 RepID=M2N4S5_BAUPA|nr:uncharacterized protein BAUCODRAFT_386644 [Baudoinia panamericana UAMH 10762]EMC98983.1 hypothetical protein BAUCODRAFT_386644 [Baudoinia panamericana UAMH 10762]